MLGVWVVIKVSTFVIVLLLTFDLSPPPIRYFTVNVVFAGASP